MIYFAEQDGGNLVLVGSTPLGQPHSAFPKGIALNVPTPWPFAEVIADKTVRVLEDLEARIRRQFPKGCLG